MVAAQSGSRHLHHEELDIAHLVDDQLVRVAHLARQACECLEHASQVLPVVAVARIQDERPLDAEATQVGRSQRLRRQLAEHCIGRARDVHHALRGQTQQANGVVARCLRNGEQQVVLRQRGQAARIPLLVVWHRVQVLLREQPGDEVVQHRHFHAAREPVIGLRHQAALAPPFEGAGAQDRVGTDRLVACVDYCRGDLLTLQVAAVARVHRRMRIRGICTGRDQAGEVVAELGRRIGIQAIGEHAHLVRTGLRCHRFRQRQRIAANAAET